MAAVIIGREFAVTVLRSLAHGRGVIIAASPLGKIKMIAEVVAILGLILGQQNRYFYLIGIIALWVAMVAAIVSGVDYYRKFVRLA
jgi:CDP-diacylglycerol--glycerol-3-phosphate 3-phosphatidyltransferase